MSDVCGGRRRFPLPEGALRFGVHGATQVLGDLRQVVREGLTGRRFAVSLSSAGILRPDLSLPAYAGRVPPDGVAPIYNLFDRTAGGSWYGNNVSRRRMRDFRGGRLSYDQHDGTDFVCPPGTPLCAPAPGVAVAVRDNWLRGGLTLCVDHGAGLVTQYSHLTRVLATPGRTVLRGEPLALSGVSGLDLAAFFPWVPPHLHFMVWLCGRPVDPFRARGEPDRPGTWLDGNEPHVAAGPLPDDPEPPALDELRVDPSAVARTTAACRSAEIRAEIDRTPSGAGRVAVLEDSLHHERFAWPSDATPAGLRAPDGRPVVRLTLPLPAEAYARARFADAPWTRPAETSGR